jgi:hypothetical protein
LPIVGPTVTDWGDGSEAVEPTATMLLRNTTFFGCALVLALAGPASAADPKMLITDLPDAPFVIETCDVALGPNNTFRWIASFLNRDPAGRTADQFSMQLLFRNASGGAVLGADMFHRALAPVAKAGGPPPEPSYTQAITAKARANIKLSTTASVECRPLQANFVDGTTWNARGGTRPGATAEFVRRPAPASECLAPYRAGKWKLAEDACIAYSNRAAENASMTRDATVQHDGVVSEFRGWLVAARSASHLGDLRTVSRLLNAAARVSSVKNYEALAAEFPSHRCVTRLASLDTCMNEDMKLAQSTFAHASVDQRRVFLQHGLNSSDYHGVPCKIVAPGNSATTWTYCDRLAKANVYKFKDGKVVSSLDTRNVPSLPPS